MSVLGIISMGIDAVNAWNAGKDARKMAGASADAAITSQAMADLQYSTTKELWTNYKKNIEPVDNYLVQKKKELVEAGFEAKDTTFKPDYPDDLPGLREQEEAINKGYDSTLANLRRDMATRNQYEPTSSALGKSLESSAGFRRASDIGQARKDDINKQALWDIERQDKEIQNVSNWLQLMQGIPSSGQSAPVSAISSASNSLNSRSNSLRNAANTAQSNANSSFEGIGSFLSNMTRKNSGSSSSSGSSDFDFGAYNNFDSSLGTRNISY